MFINFNKTKQIVGFIAFVLALSSLTGCNLFKKRSSLNMSYLENYSADIADAKGIGSIDNEFVKQDSEGNIKPINYMARADLNTKKRGVQKRKAIENQELLTPDDLNAALVQYNVYDDLTFVKYGPKFENNTFYDYDGKEYSGKDGTYGLYINRYGKKIVYYRDVIRVENGEVSYVVDNKYYSNEIYQSFVIDNKSGYIYSLDFLYYSNTGDAWGMEIWNREIVESYFEVHSNKIKFFSLDESRMDDPYVWYQTDLIIKVENDNLVIEELGISTNLRDKYNQYYLFQNDIAGGRTIYSEKKLLVNETVYLNDDKEAIGLDESGLYKYQDNFERVNYSLNDGEVFYHNSAESGCNSYIPSDRFANRGISGRVSKKMAFYYDNTIFFVMLGNTFRNTDDYPICVECFSDGRHYASESYWESKARSLMLVNFNCENIFNDDFGQYLYLENNNLYCMSLSEYFTNRYPSNSDIYYDDETEVPHENAVKIMEGVSSIEYASVDGNDNYVIKVKDNNVFGQNEYYLYLTENGYRIVLAKEYVPDQRTYTLTPINK